MPTLNWIGKDAVVNHHREVPYHLLRCDSKLSVGDPGSHLLNEDTSEKQTVGQLWEARSKGLCAFRLATKKNMTDSVLAAVR